MDGSCHVSAVAYTAIANALARCYATASPSPLRVSGTVGTGPSTGTFSWRAGVD